MSAAARTPNLTRQRVRIIEILQTSPDGAPGNPGRPGRRADPAMPGSSCLRRREQPPTPFVQAATNRGKPLANR
jgi:hypothetical protein